MLEKLVARSDLYPDQLLCGASANFNILFVFVNNMPLFSLLDSQKEGKRRVILELRSPVACRCLAVEVQTRGRATLVYERVPKGERRLIAHKGHAISPVKRSALEACASHAAASQRQSTRRSRMYQRAASNASASVCESGTRVVLLRRLRPIGIGYRVFNGGHL